MIDRMMFFYLTVGIYIHLLIFFQEPSSSTLMYRSYMLYLALNICISPIYSHSST
jgi:hypothetical protein